MANKTSGIEERVRSLETKLNVAATIAVLFGISVAGLGTWLRIEEGRVSALHTQIAEMTPIVNAAQEAILRTSGEQIQLIQSQAEPIVERLTQEQLGRINGQIKDLQTEAFFILYATVVYSGAPSGKYHDKLNDRKNQFFDRFGRSKDEIQALLAAQGYSPN